MRALLPRVLRGAFAELVRVLAAVLRFGLAAVPAAPREDFARDAGAFLAVDLVAVLRVAVLRVVPALRAPPLRAELDEAEPLALSSLHLPDITRWAASATASAMIEPSLVALDIMLLAACDAVSAASRPASRILRRAAGLALIAAAAAARPAASISLLIAALASLSTVDWFDPDVDCALEREDLELLVRADLAICCSPSVAPKRHLRAVTVPE